jgi:hypothetical protein
MERQREGATQRRSPFLSIAPSLLLSIFEFPHGGIAGAIRDQE